MTGTTNIHVVLLPFHKTAGSRPDFIHWLSGIKIPRIVVEHYHSIIYLVNAAVRITVHRLWARIVFDVGVAG